MHSDERQAFWESIENGNNPLLSAMHSLTDNASIAVIDTW